MFLQSTRESRPVAFGSGFEKKVLLKKISEMEDLPSLDVSVAAIIAMLNDQDVAIEELVKAIERDQVLVAKLLKLINSGFYSLRKSVNSVERAILLLGMLKLKQLIYSASIMDLYSDEHIVEWNHAYTSSFLMARVMQEARIPAASNLPLSMLMHDIGKVVLRRYSAAKFRTAVERAQEDGSPVFQAEEIVIGIDHADVGGMLLEKWGVGADIFMPVRQHHWNETPEEYARETILLQFADWIDCTARALICFRPSPDQLRLAGLGHVDTDALLTEHRAFIETVEPPAVAAI